MLAKKKKEVLWQAETAVKAQKSRSAAAVAEVRQKLEEDPSHPRYIISARSEGYWLAI